MLKARTCPSCHQNIPDQSQSCVPGGRDEEIAFINQEIRRVDQQVAQLIQDKATLLRSLNAVQSPIMRLPSETLSSIFEYTCPPPDFNDLHVYYYYNTSNETADNEYFQFTLGAVSSHWRQVVRSNPHLWKWAELLITTSNVEKKAMFLRLFIENSKKVSFTLALQFSLRVGSEESPCLVHPTIDDLLIETLPRIKGLYLVSPPRQWHNYTLFLTHIQECSLDLSLPFGPGREDPVSSDQITLPMGAPLRRVSLQEVICSNTDLQLPWTTITSLSLSCIPPDLSVQVFIQCPNLVEYRYFAPSDQGPQLGEPGEVSLRSPFSSHFLVDFHLNAYDTPWIRALLQHLQLPALRRMHWNTFDDDAGDDFNSLIQGFLGRLPSTLTTVVLEDTAYHLEYIPDDLNIEKLVLCHCTDHELRTLFHILTPNLQEGRTVKPLPHLKIMTIHGKIINETFRSSGNGIFRESDSIALVEMLEQRLIDTGDSFVLEVHKAVLDFALDARTRLGRLIRKGFGIRIIQGLEEDLWL